MPKFEKLGHYYINLENVAYVQQTDTGVKVQFVGSPEYIMLENEDAQAILRDVADFLEARS